MKRFKLAIILMLMALVCSPAFASVGVMVNGTMCGTATDLNFAANTTVTTDGSRFNVTLTTTGITGAITSGTINNTVLNNDTIGLTTAAAANFTNVSISGTVTPAILNATGNGTVNGILTVVGNTSLANVSIAGQSSPATLLVTGNSTLNGTITLNSAQICGNATLLNGTKLVNSTAITNNSLVFLTRSAVNTGVTGTVYVLSRNAGVNFTLNSTAATDNSTMNYLIIN